MKTSAHEKFLEMLGWEGDELKSFLPDWKRAAKLMGLSDKDVAFAVEQWIPAYWDLSLSGVKKFVAACIRGVVEVAGRQVQGGGAQPHLHEHAQRAHPGLCQRFGRGRSACMSSTPRTS